MSFPTTRREFLKMLPAVVPVFQFALLPAADEQHIELRSDFLRLTVVAGRSSVRLQQFFLKRSKFDATSFTAEPFTKDLLQPLGSSTAILLEEGMWQAAHLGAHGTVTAGPSSVHIAGIIVGPDTAPLARETWTITLNHDALEWRIEREFLRRISVRADRFPCLSMQTLTAEVAGFLDPTALIQSPGLFPVAIAAMGETISLPPGVQSMGEMISPTRSQQIHLSPSGLVLESTMTDGLFSFAKRAQDGQVEKIIIGCETVDRAKGPVVRLPGFKQQQEWTLRLRDDLSSASFQLELPDGELTAQTRSLANVHHQWMGWIFGNSPCSISYLGEMVWFPMAQSIYAWDPITTRALNRQLEFFAATAVKDTGYVEPRWYENGYYHAPWGDDYLPIPHLILAMHEQTINTGDRNFLEGVMPTVDRVANYLLAMDRDGDGIFEDMDSGLPDGGHHCTGWFDIIEFGHKDGMTNVYAVKALHAMAEMKTFLGDAAGAQRFAALYERSKAAYNKVFWDEQRGLYMDWIDVREQMPASGRRYFYTDHNLLAIILGIANATQAQRILSNLDARYAALCEQFGRQRDEIYATPANMYPVTQLGDMIDYGKLVDQAKYPSYENGCSFFHTTGFEIAARGVAGQTEQAYETFERVMMRGYAHNRLWGAALHWTDGMLFSEPLSSALLIMWGFAHGCLGIRRSLAGVEAVGGCSSRIEGAQHTFRYFGKNAIVRVEHGHPVLTQG